MRFISQYIKKRYGGFVTSLKMRFEGKANKAKGEIFLKVFDNGILQKEFKIGNHTVKLDPRTQRMVLGSNVVTLDASVLLARLMKDSTEPAAGVTHFALGTGDPSWDPFNPPNSLDTQTDLRAEVGRVGVTSASFIDPQTGLATITPTNIVDFDFDFLETDAVGYLTEAGLYGGDATSAANSGTLITYKTFPVISKTATMTISFVYRLTF